MRRDDARNGRDHCRSPGAHGAAPAPAALPFTAAAVVFEGTSSRSASSRVHGAGRFLRKSSWFSTKKAGRDRFVPRVSFAEGARETAAWYREQGMLSR